uniref:Uncharacterized protein n=1 Tax=Plectus sambesii TaxID=2011161 RepID=A0A914VKW2_9BILA
MDDDDYNALFDDVTNDFVQEAPTRSEDAENEGGLRTNAVLRRSNNADAAFEDDLRRRRLLVDSDNDPIDWHMRVSCSLDEAGAKRRKAEVDEECLSRLLLRISEARSRLMADRASSDTVEDYEQPIAVGSDIGGAKTNLHRFPPTDGSTWIPVSSTGSGRRFYLSTKADPD